MDLFSFMNVRHNHFWFNGAVSLSHFCSACTVSITVNSLVSNEACCATACYKLRSLCPFFLFLFSVTALVRSDFKVFNIILCVFIVICPLIALTMALFCLSVTVCQLLSHHSCYYLHFILQFMMNVYKMFLTDISLHICIG